MHRLYMQNGQPPGADADHQWHQMVRMQEQDAEAHLRVSIHANFPCYARYHQASDSKQCAKILAQMLCKSLLTYAGTRLAIQFNVRIHAEYFQQMLCHEV